MLLPGVLVLKWQLCLEHSSYFGGTASQLNKPEALYYPIHLGILPATVSVQRRPRASAYEQEDDFESYFLTDDVLLRRKMVTFDGRRDMATQALLFWPIV